MLENTPFISGEWYELWNKSYEAGNINRQVCVYAFLDDKYYLVSQIVGLRIKIHGKTSTGKAYK